jgi:hypothetical protein
MFSSFPEKGKGYSKCFRHFPKKEMASQMFSSFPEKGKGFSKCFRHFPKKEKAFQLFSPFPEKGRGFSIVFASRKRNGCSKYLGFPKKETRSNL